MNGKVSKMLRKSGRGNAGGKRWWHTLSKDERGQLRSDWVKLQNIQSGGVAKL